MTFFNFARNEETGAAELYIDGVIAANGWGWFGDFVTPRDFRRQLAEAQGDLTVFISSPGGDVFAGAEIYTALKEYKGTVTVKVSGIAASAASIIAMAGDKVYMSPGAYLMIHNAWTYAEGNQYDMEGARDVLREIDEGIITVYEARTGKPRDELTIMLKAGIYMSAQTAVDEGFADGILYVDEWKTRQAEGAPQEGTRAKLALHDGGVCMATIAACIAEGLAQGTREAICGHTHTVPTHTHAVPTHTHAVPTHTHAISHTHLLSNPEVGTSASPMGGSCGAVGTSANPGPQSQADRLHIQDILPRMTVAARAKLHNTNDLDARRAEIAARAKLIADLA